MVLELQNCTDSQILNVSKFYRNLSLETPKFHLQDICPRDSYQFHILNFNTFHIKQNLLVQDANGNTIVLFVPNSYMYLHVLPIIHT